MKVYRVLAMLLAAITVFCNVSAAAGFSADVSYSAEKQLITVEGVCGDKSGIAVLITVIKKGEIATAEKINSGEVIVKSVHTDKDGNYAVEITMPENFSSDTYKIHAGGSGGNTEKQFIHANKNEADDAIEIINSATDKNDFFNKVNDNISAFGMDAEEYSTYSDFVNGILYSLKPAGGYTFFLFYDYLQCGVAAYKIKNETDTLENIILQYDTNAGIDYVSEFSAYNEKVRTYLGTLLKKADYESKPFDKIYRENLVLSRINTADRYIDITPVISDECDTTDISLTKYNKLSSTKKEKVIKAVFGKVPFKSISDFKKEFDRQVTAAGINIESQGGGMGSSSEDSGSSSPAVGGSGSIPVPQVTEKSDSAIFTDMKGHWSNDAVLRLVEENVITGFEDKTFRPEEYVTRAQFVKMIVSAFGVNAGENKITFSDVNSSMWHYDYITKAANSGLVLGDNGLFRPEEKITREDAAVILYRLLEMKNSVPFGTYWFNDESSISSYSRDAVLALSGAGIINGYNGNFMPKNNTKRCEAATLIYKVKIYLEGGAV